MRWVRINKLSNKSKNAKNQSKENRLSYKEHMVDALALGAEEGRDKLRKATGKSTYLEIRRYPNVETQCW